MAGITTGDASFPHCWRWCPNFRLVVSLRPALLTMLRLERALPHPRGPEVLRVAGKPPRFYYGLDDSSELEDILPPEEPLPVAKQEDEQISLDDILREMLPPDELLPVAKQENGAHFWLGKPITLHAERGRRINIDSSMDWAS